MRAEPRWTRSPLTRLSRRPWFAAVAGFLAALFLQFEVATTWAVVSAGVASAQEGGARRLALVVVPKSPRDEVAAKQMKGLLRATADRLSNQGIDRASVSPVDDRAALATARAKVDEGRKALNAGKFDEALVAYLAAEGALKKCLPVADRVTVARAYKGLGVSLANNRRPEQAREALKKALMVYPGQKPNEYAYNLETRNLYNSVQREIDDSPYGSLVVATTPPGAEVYVDFEFRGLSPVNVPSLTTGEHLITLFADGFQATSQWVNVRGLPDQAANVMLTAAPNQKAINDGIAAATKRPAAAELGRLAETADATDVLLVIVSAEKAGFGIGGAHFRGGNVKAIKETLARDATLIAGAQGVVTSNLGVSPAGEAGGLAQLEPPPVALPGEGGGATVLEGGEDLVVDPNSPIFRDTGKKKEGVDVVKQWWFWTALVVGLGAVAGVTYWGVTSQNKDTGGGPTGDLRITLHGAP